MRTIWFIRHAESEANFGLVTQDTAKTILTPRGRAQAEYIARAFDEKPSLIITSPYVRTRLTAQPTIERFKDVPIEEWPVHEYTFLAKPRTHNTTTHQRWPMAEEYWERSDPFYVDGEGAESFADMMQRAYGVLERIKEREESFIAIFTHGQFLRAVTWAFLAGRVEINNENMRRFRSFDRSVDVPNGTILKVQFIRPGELYISNYIISHFPSDIVTYT
jgi:probable phosphoglycerate mutase